VLVARYGAKAWQVMAGGRSGSSWWKEVLRIRDGVHEVGGGDAFFVGFVLGWCPAE
jgi:hypothetical protein